MRVTSAIKAARPRVAVLGSGIAGSVVAQTLKNHGAFDIKVFETGRGPGGRSSTRLSRETDYKFDHGMQYISPPTTSEFATMMGNWKTIGCIVPWNMNLHQVIDKNGCIHILKASDPIQTAHVGSPAANSIVKHLQENVDVKFNTRAVVTQMTTNTLATSALRNGRQWDVSCAKSGHSFGLFDWIVCTDRMAASATKPDLHANNPASNTAIALSMNNFFDFANSISSAPSLALMVTFSSALVGSMSPSDQLSTINAIEFQNSEIISWAARDTSKPGRARKSEECWVVHSTESLAESVISKFCESEDVAQEACTLMLPEFSSKLASVGFNVPEITFAQGHRWSAAFPKPSLSYSELDCLLGSKWVNYGTPLDPQDSSPVQGKGFVDYENGFAACGDWLVPSDGSVVSTKNIRQLVERSALSAEAVAHALISHFTALLSK